MIGRIWSWMRAHPLAWLIPVIFWVVLLAFVLLKLSDAPETEFIYQV